MVHMTSILRRDTDIYHIYELWNDPIIRRSRTIQSMSIFFQETVVIEWIWNGSIHKSRSNQITIFDHPIPTIDFLQIRLLVNLRDHVSIVPLIIEIHYSD